MILKQTIHAHSKRNRTTIYIAAIVHASVFQPLLMFEQLAISFDVRLGITGVYKSLRYAWREAKRKTQKCKSAFVHGHLPKFDHRFVIRWIYIPVDYVHYPQFTENETKRSWRGTDSIRRLQRG